MSLPIKSDAKSPDWMRDADDIVQSGSRRSYKNRTKHWQKKQAEQ